MSDLKKRFGSLVAAHRRRNGLTQEKLAEAASISVDMVSKIENGASGASFDLVEKLASGLSVDPAELFTSELPTGALSRSAVTDLSATLAKLSDADLQWVKGVIAAALKKRS